MFLRLAVFITLLIAALLVNASGQALSVGIVGGGSLTDAFPRVDNSNELTYSQSKDYVAGAMLDLQLPLNFSIEGDGLFRELHLTEAFIEQNGTLNSVSPAPVVTWEFPVLGKYRFHWWRLRPFLEAGPEFRTTGNLNAMPSHHGVAAGVGVETHLWGLDVAPVIRYTHWAQDSPGTQTNRNQLELLVGLSRQSRLASHPLGLHVAVGAIVGTTLIHDVANSSSSISVLSPVMIPGGGYAVQQQNGTVSQSGKDSWLYGPTLELALPKSVFVEVDGFYHPLYASGRTTLSGGLSYGYSGTEASTWEFPVLAKYKLGQRRFKPFAEAGPSFRLPQQIGGHLSTHGVTAGAGVEAHWRGLRIAPVIRFTHWGLDSPSGSTGVIRNQVEFVTGFSL